MSNVGIYIIFEKEACNMVQVDMVLLRIIWVGNLYKLLGSTRIDECNSTIIHENEIDGNFTLLVEKSIMLWNQRMGRVEDKGLMYYIVNVWLEVSLIVCSNLIFVNIVYMVRKTGEIHI